MKALLAVSGGVDSMYLLARAPEFFPGAEFAVAHCNFGLRAQESDGDEQFVVNACAAAGIPCFVKHFNTTDYAREKGISTEMAARDLRYTWFYEICIEKGFDALVIAHNANDNAETLVLNLLRGSGTRGLRGMSERGHRADMPGIEILRPMLKTERRDIESWMREHSLPWREDSTNAGCDYKRNIIRNKVFPIFESINPGFIRTLSEDMERIAQADDIAEGHFREKEPLLQQSTDDGGRKIGVSGLMEDEHWSYLLYRLLEDEDINPSELSALKKTLLGRKDGGTFSGKSFGSVVTGRDSLIIPPKEQEAQKFTLEHLDAADLASPKQEKGTLVMDELKLPQNPVIRPWREGDWMRPLGMQGRRKKISDIMTDLKWPLPRKRQAMVLELEGSHVAALLCERIDEAVRITDSSKKVLRIKSTL